MRDRLFGRYVNWLACCALLCVIPLSGLSSAEDVRSALLEFVSIDPPAIAAAITERLKQLHDALHSHAEFAHYASSVLIAFDGAGAGGGGGGGGGGGRRVSVHVIDFGHAYPLRQLRHSVRSGELSAQDVSFNDHSGDDGAAAELDHK